MELRIKRIAWLSILSSLLLVLPSCYVFRTIFWYPSGVHDYRHFHADSISHQKPVSRFSVSSLPVQLKIPGDFAQKSSYISFGDLMEKSHTLAFLVIRNDTMLASKYAQGCNDSSVFASFSMAKSFVSALTGIAISEGYIRSLDQPVTDFYPELTKKGYGKVTLGDLLTMRSGIDFKEGYKDPFGDVAHIYYGRNVRKFTLGRKVITEPGKTYYYQSGNTQLLAMVLEKATGMSISKYMEEKIWKPAGMSKPASWSVDSKRNHEVKAFCCINASAPDYARFGQLYLDNGYREGKSIVPENWVKESLTIQTDSKDSRGYPYTYYWRVRKDGEFFSYGVLGQYIYVSPAKKIVLVRIGDQAGGINWPDFMHKLIRDL